MQKLTVEHWTALYKMKEQFGDATMFIKELSCPVKDLETMGLTACFSAMQTALENKPGIHEWRFYKQK